MKFWDKTHQNLVRKKKMKKHILVFTCPPLLLQDVTALNTKKGTTPKSVFSRKPNYSKICFQGSWKVLADLHVGSS